ncbi:hypothetical protein AB0945_27170 [Streptomyces sp. NPDC005474]|uniref:hypothetical protein n=1 Tax=Streptomyces sp. NPDC005474 TaxID=3154878 RepID=UPI0034528B05
MAERGAYLLKLTLYGTILGRRRQLVGATGFTEVNNISNPARTQRKGHECALDMACI